MRVVCSTSPRLDSQLLPIYSQQPPHDSAPVELLLSHWTILFPLRRFLMTSFSSIFSLFTSVFRQTSKHPERSTNRPLFFLQQSLISWHNDSVLICARMGHRRNGRRARYCPTSSCQRHPQIHKHRNAFPCSFRVIIIDKRSNRQMHLLGTHLPQPFSLTVCTCTFKS